MKEDNIQEFMKPRYKVIADYPGSIFDTGAILVQNMDTVGEVFMDSRDQVDPDWRFRDSNWIDPNIIPKYPHLFKKMNWWEDRKPEDMPDYIVNIEFGSVYKIEYQSKVTPSDVFTNKAWASLYDCQPATLADYESFTKLKQ